MVRVGNCWCAHGDAGKADESALPVWLKNRRPKDMKRQASSPAVRALRPASGEEPGGGQWAAPLCPIR